jgi:uncharacterized protein (TIGR03118 family)
MQSFVRRFITVAAGLVLFSGMVLAQTSYFVTNLTSDVSGKTKNTDPLLANPWGLAYAPGGAFWVSDEASGWSTLYNGKGVPQSLQVVVPTASGTGFGTPTGIVYNGSQEFAIDSWVSVFLFATLDGSIQGWSSFNPSATLVGATQSGAVYTGLAITSHSSGNFLYAADAANNKVDVYDGTFSLVMSFTDPTIPAGFAPFGIQDIGGQVYVTYAAQNGGSGGYVDIFTESGTFVKRFASGKPLNQPWGMAVAPSNFGPMSNAFLVTNNTTNGGVNAFNASTGRFMGALKNSSGKALLINGIWGIEFGGGTANNGQKNQLFFTAGPNDEQGYFGFIGTH